ncbi:PREDICTED: uncharacterized protein LOC108772495 [Cyphomyrmex costatus]|uniref:uncharacterized protein LOC108772495 n=1 Tax=Cyphomyrmex costatus TaxID=456900 RepID=UPI00085226FE|nr:PREDICTED: uncharacterized protein LOC108772495 [Cyphomyrmex costatus]
MICCKIYLTLSALITCHVSANYERLKNWSPSESISHSWNNQYDIYEGAPSEILPDYSFYELSKDQPIDRFGSPSEPFPITIKKEPIEEKYLKKIPFYVFSNKDSTRYKELTPDLGVAHCQEIKVKSIGKDGEPRKGITTCYNCKDPKTKSTYERCLYSSHPEESVSANTKVESYLSAPTIFRYRRSNYEGNKDNYGQLRNPYRFTDEYFTDATHGVPTAYKNKGEKCDKIVKDSMVCMVCKDAKTNGKYEQCSYVKPHEKAYSYVKSSTFGKPQKSEENDSDERPDPSSVESHEYSYPSEDYSEKTSVNEQDEVKDAPSSDCKQVQKDSKTCTVCKDSKTGGTYEKCTYNYQPSDKLYKYSRSKTFGFPDKTSDSTRDSQDSNKSEASEKSKNFDYSQGSDSAPDYIDKSEQSTYPRKSNRAVEVQQVPNDSDGTSHNSPNYSSDYSNSEASDYQFPSYNSDSESYDGQKTSSSKPVSESYSENISSDNCKTLQKDSMTCKICKDPQTGNDFEQCSYSYQPSDKLFSYSTSRSFSTPQKSERTPHEDKHPSDSSEITKKSYDEYVPGLNYEASSTDEATSRDDAEGKKGVEAGYLDTVKKKAEIEEFMQKFQKEDRSNCKKIMRDKMTCYQCIDGEGFQKEECAFVTGQEPDKDQLVFHETKEFQVDSAPRVRDIKSSSSTKTKGVDSLEPSTSASKNSYVRVEKPDNDYPDEASHTAEETKEAEPYDYTSETRAKYDKVLRLTLPAYMSTTSEHEAAFDEIVASDQDQR